MYMKWCFAFLIAVCEDLYNNLCRFWSDYCKPDALKFVGKKIVKKYRLSCPVTCKKCRKGQKMLGRSSYLPYSEYMLRYQLKPLQNFPHPTPSISCFIRTVPLRGGCGDKRERTFSQKQDAKFRKH